MPQLQFSLDTHKYRRFSAALVEAKSERRVYLDPDWVDNGRYRVSACYDGLPFLPFFKLMKLIWTQLQCILNLEPGYLACLLNCRTVFEHDTYPRPVKFKITVGSLTSLALLAEFLWVPNSVGLHT